jgi:hypothetical protein
MQRAAILGDALGLYFGRDPLRAADAAGLVYMRSAGLSTLRAVFLPALVPDGRAVIAISASASRRDILQWVAVALGHHFLGHRSFDAYLYGADGPLFDDGASAHDAFVFTQCFFLGVDAQPTAQDEAARN